MNLVHLLLRQRHPPSKDEAIEKLKEKLNLQEQQ